jgi:predicted enzyme related to lactoylglutathione lyase
MKLNGILLGSENPQALADFYTLLLGQPSWHDGDWYGYSADAQIGIGPHSEVKGKNQSPGRIMLMFEVEDIQHEFARIKSLGAAVIAEPYHPGQASEIWLATLADPDDNYFQLATPMTQPAK